MGAVEHVAMLRARLEACERALELERAARAAADKNAKRFHALMLQARIERIPARDGR